MTEVLALHDCRAVEVFAYYCGPDAKDPLHAHFKATSDHFTPISALDDDAAARRIAQDGIQILVNLNGYTREARLGVGAPPGSGDRELARLPGDHGQPASPGTSTACSWTASSSRGYIGANPDKLKVVGDALGTDNSGFIFKLGSDLVGPFNAAIAALKADGTLDRLTNKWFYEYNAK